MLRFPTWPALALLCALLCGLTACAPTAIGSASPTATATILPTPTVTPTLVLAPTPTNVPAGWKVLATTHVSLAYPPDWTVDTATFEGGQSIVVWAPAKKDAVQVIVNPRADLTPSFWADVPLYCQPESHGARSTTFANLPMTLQLTGLGNAVRVWRFVNAQRTLYSLSAGADVGTSAAVQAQHEAILATFRPDNADPWHC